MGWASGSQLAEDVWAAVRNSIPAGARQPIAKKIVDLFEDYDCDTMPEAMQLYADAGWVYDTELDQYVYLPL